MTPGEYKQARQRVGTQEEAAERLQVSRVTVARRETGAMVITEEASLAISALGKKRRLPRRGVKC